MKKLHVRDLLPDYAWGLLEPEEMLRVETHLERCPSCRKEKARWDRLTGAMVWNSAVEPPSGLEDKILATLPPLDPLPRKLSVWPWAASLATAAALVALAGNAYLWNAAQTKAPPPGLATVTLKGNADYPAAYAQLIIDYNKRSGVLAVQGLPPLSEEVQYQFWLIDENERWIAAGTFDATAAGSSVHVVNFPDDPKKYGAFCVSVEPRGGSKKPSSLRLMGGAI